MSLFRRGHGGTVLKEDPAPPDTVEVGATMDENDHASAIVETIDLLDQDISILIGQVLAEVDCVNTSASTTSEALCRIQAAATGLVDSSATAQTNAAGLAAASEELARTSESIGEDIDATDRLIHDIHSGAREAGTAIDHLRASSESIGEIVVSIDRLARRTHLLSLNATIEANAAGKDGAAFAVVAREFKMMSQETQEATRDVAQKIALLRSAAQASIVSFRAICEKIELVQPMVRGVTSALGEQNQAVSTLAHDACQTAGYVNRVVDIAGSIQAEADLASRDSIRAEQAVRRVAEQTGKLGERFTVFLRQSTIGNRRSDERLPVELDVSIAESGRPLQSRTQDLSLGGFSMAKIDGWEPAVGTRLDVELQSIGRVAGILVNTSKVGLHVKFDHPTPDIRDRIQARIEALAVENARFIEIATGCALRISHAIEAALRAGHLTRQQLLDNRYSAIEGSDPVQYSISYLDALRPVVPPIQDAAASEDDRILTCVVTDRNCYIPFHQARYSQEQRTNDREWNNAHCRDRRIWDDRAGLAAARNMRPYLMQSYMRFLSGKPLHVREVAVPLRLDGTHWGALRLTFRL